jgi:hypothetical protein
MGIETIIIFGLMFGHGPVSFEYNMRKDRMMFELRQVKAQQRVMMEQQSIDTTKILEALSKVNK